MVQANMAIAIEIKDLTKAYDATMERIKLRAATPP
jgi:hypothetical protein